MLITEREKELLRGTVTAVVFRNAENGYSIIKLRDEADSGVTVVGTIPMPVVGERLEATGRWINHATYGRQFEAEFLQRLMPETSKDILAYLSSHAVKGVGEVTAGRIVDAFGARALDVIENEPERLSAVAGISRKKAFELSADFRRQVGVRRLMEFLSAHSLPAELAVRLYRSYGDIAMDAVSEDPYLLTEPQFGADFGTVDAFAQSMDVPADNDGRVEAGILFELTHNLGNGHVFIPEDKLTAAAAMLLGLETAVIADGLERLGAQGRMIRDELLERAVCYLPELYEAETFVAERVGDMARQTLPEPHDLEQMLSDIAARRQMRYAENQLAAIRAAATRQMLAVTGGPGTGKTTTMSGILALFDLLGLKTLLAAPTGRAAKRLGECTGREATTIHRLLESQYDEESGLMLFFHNETEPLKADALIVDEASMIDLPLMHSLLRGMRPDCRLVLVGDPDQLPSVGAGNVFSDILRSGAVTTAQLTEIFRQAQQSLIVMNAHAINRGEMPELAVRDRDFFFMRRREGEGLVATVQELCATRLPQNMGIRSEEIQVLSPTRKGVCGTYNLNQKLQEVLNPPAAGKKEKIYGDITFREGDRVMQIRNNYDIMWEKTDGLGCGTGIFNGDIGRVSAIDHSAETLTVLFDDRRAVYSFDLLSELEMAYAMTVHKSQGSEYRAVILAALGGPPMLLARGVLYTAVTRARELLIVVGSEDTVAAMVANNRQQKRFSGLKLRLEAAL